MTLTDLLDEPARVDRTHAHAGAQPRLYLGDAEALDLKPGKEAPLRLLDVRTRRASRLAKQPLEFGQYVRSCGSDAAGCLMIRGLGPRVPP